MNPNKLFFSKDKFIGSKKSFRMVINGSKVSLFTPIIYIPFGIESYNGKHILNFEVDTERNNDLYNFYAQIYKIESVLQNLITPNINTDDENNETDNELIDENIKSNHLQIYNLIKGKQFVSCIKNGLKGYLIRSYVNQGIDIKSNNNDFFSINQTKGKLAKLQIELGNLWIMPDTFGYILNITEITIMN